jgi:hypothetical protein
MFEVNLEYNNGEECLRKRERKEERKKWVQTGGERENKEGRERESKKRWRNIVGRESEGEFEREGSCLR